MFKVDSFKNMPTPIQLFKQGWPKNQLSYS